MRVLAVGAHPDDVEFSCAGTLAKYAKRGDKVIIAIATNGEVGSPTLSKEKIAGIREKEARESAKVIGAELIWMGYPDEFLFSNEESRLKFIDMIRQARPDIILIPYKDDYHPDHFITGQIANDAKIMTAVPNIVTKHKPCKKIPRVYYMDTLAGVNFVPQVYMDITDTFEIKKKMLSKHKSQKIWLKELFGMTPLDFIEIMSKFRGIQVGVKYAEAFRNAAGWPLQTVGEFLP